MIHELNAGELYHAIDPAALGVESTAQLTPLVGIIGQKRAVSALQFGLGIQDGGFNIYVSGPPGIGKMTAVQSFIRRLAEQKPTPPDWCYVNDFDDPNQPRVFSLPAGRGRVLRDDMAQLIEDVRREIPKAFESEPYSTKRDGIKSALNQKRDALLENLGERATAAGFTMQLTPLGVLMLPVKDGHPLNEIQFQQLPPAERLELEGRHKELQERLETVLKEGRNFERAARDEWQELDRQVALYVVGGLIDDVADKFKDSPDATAFIAAVKKDILENIEVFKASQAALAASTDTPMPSPWLQELPFRKYQVNIIVDNSKQQGAPVVVQLNPSYNNLFGRIDKETHLGSLYTDFTLIKSGSLHTANGGFLVMPVEDVLRNAYCWEGLKRALRSGEVEIEDLGERLGFWTTKTLRPQPMPLKLKVVLIGQPYLFHLLHSVDQEFPELFKVKADFDTVMPRTDENTRNTMEFAAMVCSKEKLRPLDATALAKLLEHAIRLAEDQTKLSTHFGELADMMREANFWAEQDKAEQIGAAHILRALDEKLFRSNLIQEHIEEMIARRELLVDTAGQAVGQVNGLSVWGVGDYAFGKPSRITATVGPGREGVVDIEREVELSGPIHSKGVLILSGYLAHRFAQERMLSLDARLVFEQSYEGVEGDSASSAELYALLSALSNLPLSQSIAVTGSVNQHGQVQAIGGVNVKIEGFFEVCRITGLNGSQGVLIPQSNVQNLMLRPHVVQAVREGKFHIWAIETVDDGIEVLTGVPAGTRDVLMEFPAGTVNYAVDRRLEEYVDYLREFGSDHGEPDKEDDKRSLPLAVAHA